MNSKPVIPSHIVLFLIFGIAIVVGLVLLVVFLMRQGADTENINDADQQPNQAEVISLPLEAPVFSEVSVHDPAIVRVDGTFYVFGSHLASAKSNDLMQWEQISSTVHEGNVLIPNVKEELSEVFEWAETNTLWAPDVIQLNDGRFYMYYNACRGDSPLSGLGIAVSENIEGPYKDLGLILKSGMWGQESEDGTVYDANIHPNVVDPDLFYCSEGDLWMVYGSYSGGIFILEMNPETGFPFPEQGYGKKLTGGYHGRIEGPHILYNPDTDYYYLFVSFGGLTADGGYNIRVARSKNPDGPYYDSMGNDMIECKGLPGTIFHDPSIEPYGTKLIGNYQFQLADGEPAMISIGYVSPGHSSAYFDEETGKYYLFFHTRFAGRGEIHEVRVHQMFFNGKGWPVVAPYRYSAESIGEYSEADVIGEWKLIEHKRDISAKVKRSSLIMLNEDLSISGEATGTWELSGGNSAAVTIDGVVYNGVFLSQWDTNNWQEIMTFTLLSEEKGKAIWGSKVLKGTYKNQ